MASRRSQVSPTRAEIAVDHNTPRSVRRKRTEKSTVVVRHLCPNLGTDGAICSAALRTSSALSTQITFSSTFTGIRRHLLQVDWFLTESKGSQGKPLAIAIRGDPTCIDCNRVFRLRGFAKCKKDPVYHVRVKYSGDSIWDSDDFRLRIPASDTILSSPAFTARKHFFNPTDTGPDSSWTLHELAYGKDAAKLTRKLASRRADKRNCLYHARRTADTASDRLRLVESIPIKVAVILLEGCRHLEIALVLCRARAQKAHSLGAGGEAVIRASISCRSKNGASHRKNFDTPSLKGRAGAPRCTYSRFKDIDI